MTISVGRTSSSRVNPIELGWFFLMVVAAVPVFWIGLVLTCPPEVPSV